MSGYPLVALAALLTVYGQVMIKWRVDKAGEFPASGADRLRFFGDLLLDPWVMTVLVASLAAAAVYLVALTKLELSRAYPVMSLTFVLVPLSGVVIFRESLSAAAAAGIVLIVVGLVVGSQA
jgi:multidrug transporter EmrE-like cation transporter